MKQSSASKKTRLAIREFFHCNMYLIKKIKKIVPFCMQLITVLVIFIVSTRNGYKAIDVVQHKDGYGVTN